MAGLFFGEIITIRIDCIESIEIDIEDNKITIYTSNRSYTVRYKSKEEVKEIYKQLKSALEKL